MVSWRHYMFWRIVFFGLFSPQVIPQSPPLPMVRTVPGMGTTSLQYYNVLLACSNKLYFSVFLAHGSPPQSPPLPMVRTVPGMGTTSLPHSGAPNLGLILQQPPPPSQVCKKKISKLWIFFWKFEFLASGMGTTSLPHSWAPNLGLILQQPPPPSQVGLKN